MGTVNYILCGGEELSNHHNINLSINWLLSDTAINKQVFICVQLFSGQKTPSVDKNISSSQHIPDVPTGVALLPRSPCGIHVLWNPIRYSSVVLQHVDHRACL